MAGPAAGLVLSGVRALASRQAIKKGLTSLAKKIKRKPKVSNVGGKKGTGRSTATPGSGRKKTTTRRKNTQTKPKTTTTKPKTKTRNQGRKTTKKKTEAKTTTTPKKKSLKRKVGEFAAVGAGFEAGSAIVKSAKGKDTSKNLNRATGGTGGKGPNKNKKTTTTTTTKKAEAPKKVEKKEKSKTLKLKFTGSGLRSGMRGKLPKHMTDSFYRKKKLAAKKK